jgi:hypothetical protein
MPYLDLVEHHKRYCPWINGHAQSAGMPWNGGGPDQGRELAGWKFLGKHIENVKLEREREGEVGSSKKPATPLGKEEREVKDKERWAKLKRLKQAFKVKRVKKGGAGKENVVLVSRPGTATSSVAMSVAGAKTGSTTGTIADSAGGTTAS